MSNRQLQLAIPGSPDTLHHTRNVPGTRPYCNRQPLKKLQIKQNRNNLIFHANNF